MPKIYLYLIIVWSLACASGLGIFLFQVFGPKITNEPAYSGAALAITVGFWVVAWAVPSAIITHRGRSAGQQQ